ncbi:MAG: hypothetical protein SCALA702_30200 [Melioribacteraceae bacterium]|nr:MAG: hypothetical protein SCALA702_30200 [Melioribacteraceae bacterium]
MLRIYTIILLALLTVSCYSGNEKKSNAPLELIARFNIDVPEPSGLTLDYDGTLWCVSDKNGHVYHLDTTGAVLDKFDLNLKDLEGITVIDSFRLAVVSESKNLLAFINRNGDILAEEKIKYKNKSNSGFEGITYSIKEGLIFILNEKKPGALLGINENFVLTEEVELGFLKDYSGIYYSDLKKEFWILSHESKTLLLLNRDYEKLREFKFNTPQMEGIAVDFTNSRLYIVSDPEEKLFVYKINKYL